MKMIAFSRMCEALEDSTPTRRIKTIASTLSSLDTSDRELLVNILCLDYNMNNIGEKKAVKWLAEMYGVFEDEIIEESHKWMDLGEGMLQFLDFDGSDSNMNISSILALLELDCSKRDSNAYVEISNALHEMSSLEVKWFIRYWLRTPRNGINKKTVEKAISSFYDRDITDVARANQLSHLIHYFDNDKEPPSIVFGSFIKPMLAKKYNGSLPDNFIIDIKYDGNRYQIHRHADDVIIFNRKGKIVTEQFPDVVTSMKWDLIDFPFIVDCEIYPVDTDGNPRPHQSLGTRVHSKDKAKAVIECPVKVVAFDCMMYDEVSVLHVPYEERLQYLEEVVPGDCIATRFNHGNILAAYNVAVSGGFEGIMIKDLDAKYESKRTNSLLKYKPPRIELDVVITSGAYGKGKRASMIATYGISVKANDSFVEIGNVGSGISENEMAVLSSRLKKIVDVYGRGNTNFHFLPRIVLEVTCDSVTKNQDGTYGLRFPRILRIRDDKYPADCNTLEDIEDLCSNI